MKIIIETPKKSAKTRISCIDATPSAVRICAEHYTNRKGMCITQGYPVPCKVEYIFNDSANQIEEFETLKFEDHANIEK